MNRRMAKTFPRVLIILLAITQISWAQKYRITDLGTLPGHNYSYAIGINSLGQIVGVSENASDYNSRRAFLWTKKAGMKDLGVLQGAAYSTATGINDLGQVVGNSGANAFLWTASGGMQDLGAIGDVEAINNSGQIVGFDGRAFIWTKQNGKQYLDPTFWYSAAADINDLGQIAGSYFPLDEPGLHAFRWSTAVGMQMLWYGGATAINNLGQVVGGFNEWGYGDAALWTQGSGARDLGTMPGGTFSVAEDINDVGQVVGIGNCNTAPTCSYEQGGHAFLWTDATGMQDLNDLIPRNSRWVLGTLWFHINNFGLIVGSGKINDQTHAVLLTPVGRSHQKAK